MKKADMYFEWAPGNDRQLRIGVAMLYLLALGIYSYFMGFDTLFEGSSMPFIIAMLAYALVLPMAILPTKWWLLYRVHRLEALEGYEVNPRLRIGSHLILTPEGKVVVFEPEKTWKVKRDGSPFITGVVMERPAQEREINVMNALQEHWAWAKELQKQTPFWMCGFYAITIILLMTNEVQEALIGEGHSPWLVLWGAVVFLWVIGGIVKWFMRVLHLQEQGIAKLHYPMGDNVKQFGVVNSRQLDSVTNYFIKNEKTVYCMGVGMSGALYLKVADAQGRMEHVLVEAQTKRNR